MDISEVYESYTYSGGLVSLKDIFFVAAIDFGTSFSGYAFAIRVDKEKDSSTIYVPNWYASDAGLITFKIPTTVLLDKDEQFVDFGFEAEFTYAELLENGKHNEYFYFRHFQLMFNNLAKSKVQKYLNTRNWSEYKTISFFFQMIHKDKKDKIYP